jgi:transposase
MSAVKLGRRIAMDPTCAQESRLWQSVGVSRFAWNWGIAMREMMLQAWRAETDPEWKRRLKPTTARLKEIWAEVRRTDYKWSLDVTKCAGTQAIIDLGATYDRAIKEVAEARRRGRLRRPQFGFPRFMAKFRDTPAFAVWNDQLDYEETNGMWRVRLPLVGWVKLHEPMPSMGGILGARVSWDGARWHISFQFDTEWVDGEQSDKSAEMATSKARKAAVFDGMDADEAKESIKVVSERPERLLPLHAAWGLVGGVDGGLKSRAVLRVEDTETGDVVAEKAYHAPKRRRDLQKRIARAQKRFAKGMARKRKKSVVTKANGKQKVAYEPLARDQRQTLSNRDKKRLRKVQRLEAKAANQRNDDLHKLTTEGARACVLLVGENLNVRGMMRNHRLAGSLSDASLSKMIGLYGYKLPREGGLFLRAPRFFPSSKRCSACGHVLDELELDVRDWTCPCCGVHHDRDGNASANLCWLARLVAMTDETEAYRQAGEADPGGRIGLLDWLRAGRATWAELVSVRDRSLEHFRAACMDMHGDGEALAADGDVPGETALETPPFRRDGSVRHTAEPCHA